MENADQSKITKLLDKPIKLSYMRMEWSRKIAVPKFGESNFD